MGFKLTNEGKIIPNKFILSERLVLNEAIDEKTARNYLTDLIEFTKTALNSIDNDEADNESSYQTINKLYTTTRDLGYDLQNMKDPAMVKANAAAFVSDIEEIVDAIDDDNSHKAAINNAFKDVLTTARSSDFTKDTVKKLKAQIATAVTALDALMQDVDSATGEDSTVSKADQLEILSNAYRDFLVASKLKTKDFLADFCSDIEAIYKVAQKAMANTATEKDFVNFLNICKQKHDGNFGKHIKDLQDTNNIDVETEINTDKAEKIDWGKKFQNAQNKEAFWEEYYRVVWGNIAKKIAALGEAFRQECAVLGFDGTSNPFINYVTKVIKEDGYTIDAAHYTLIHDAVASKSGRTPLTKSDISPTSTLPPLAGINIIYCKDFFAKNPKDAARYLEIMGNLRVIDAENLPKLKNPDTAKKISDDKIKDSFRNVVSHVDNLTQLIYAVLYQDSITATDLVKTSVSAANVSVNPIDTAKLRSLSDITTIMAIINAPFGGQNGWSDEETNDLVDFIKNHIPAANQPTVAKKYVVALATLFMSSGEMATFSGSYKWWPDGTPATAANQPTTIDYRDLKTLIHDARMTSGDVKAIATAFDDPARNWLN